MSPRMIWPVYGHAPRETLAEFFDSSDAESFAIHPEDFGAERRNLYVDEPRYDRRERGYPISVAPLVGDEHLGPGRIAA